MPNVFINDTIAHEGGLIREHDRKTGWNTRRRFKGSQAYIEAKEAQAIALGYNTSIEQGAVWTLEATVPAKDDGSDGGQADQPVDTWELFPNVIEKDLLQSDSDAIKKLSINDVAWLRDLMEGKYLAKDWSDVDPAFDVATGSDPSGVKSLIISGWKSKRIYQQMLRHTKTISNAYQVPASLTRVGQIYSTAQILSDESVTPLIAGSLEASSAHSRADGVVLVKGWLKARPFITESAYGKGQIVQEWEWGDWAILAYTTYGTFP